MGTEILSPGWQERTGMDYSDLIWVETGETLDGGDLQQVSQPRDPTASS